MKEAEKFPRDFQPSVGTRHKVPIIHKWAGLLTKPSEWGGVSPPQSKVEKAAVGWSNKE